MKKLIIVISRLGDTSVLLFHCTIVPTASSKEDLKIFIFILETYIFFKFEHSVDVALEEAFSYCLALITNFKLVFTQQYRTEKIRN